MDLLVPSKIVLCGKFLALRLKNGLGTCGILIVQCP